MDDILEYNNIRVFDVVQYELDPTWERPRWMPHPEVPNTFVDKGYSGKFTCGEVDKIYKSDGIMMVRFMFPEHGLYLKMPYDIYIQNMHLPGFYSIQTEKPICDCGNPDGLHWQFCKAWTRGY